MTWKVPYSGISNRLGLEEAEAVMRVMRQDTLMKGPTARLFEQEFAQRLGVKHALAMTSCTTALFLAAQILKLQAGDEVITTPQTFWVTTWPMLARGCKIRFADIEPNTLNIDPNAIEPLINEKTKAICVVHFGGQAVDLDPIMALARRYNLRVIEDCAHTPGACYKDRCVGTFGDVGCFSFQSLKNMTTGEGGMLVTNDDKLFEYAERLGTLHMHGEMVERADKHIGPYAEPDYYRDWHAQNAFNMDYVDGRFQVGNNYRMGDLQAAVGRVQLGKLDQLNDRRREIGHTRSSITRRWWGPARMSSSATWSKSRASRSSCVFSRCTCCPSSARWATAMASARWPRNCISSTRCSFRSMLTSPMSKLST
jgi:perosamine synthetase